jgi:ribose-phosphate pyrophosphokinase
VTDACRRAAAARITAVVPYFGYARSDRRAGRRCAINAHLVASLMQTAGIDHVVTVDLHADQIEGFFDIPMDEISAVSAIADDLLGRLDPDVVVVSPDEGRVRMASSYAHLLGAQVAVLHKKRSGDRRTKVMRVVGEVRGRPCLIVDDMISTGLTVDSAVTALLEAGARPGITVAATHGLLLEGAKERLSRPEISEVVVSDTVAILDPCFRKRSPDAVEAVRVVSMAPALAQLLGRVLASNLHDGC